MALYIPHSIFRLARLLYVRPETFGPYYVLVILKSTNINLYTAFTKPAELSRYSNSLHAERKGVRTLLGETFSASAQTDAKAHPASCKMGFLFRGKEAGAWRCSSFTRLAPRLKKE